MNFIGTIFIYAAFFPMFLGGVSVVRPWRFMGIASRPHGFFVMLCGAIVFLIGAALPTPDQRIVTPATLLDDFVPVYQFSEFHTIRIRASRERVYAAIQDVTADEITLFRTLTWIRRFGRAGKESILNAPPNDPILAVALRTSFMKLAEDPNREIVLGTLAAAQKGALRKRDPTPGDFKALHAPGFALAAMNFRLLDSTNGETLATTETRVFATDISTRTKFAGYWRVIYPGSALIRMMWLRAIRHRAEKMTG